MFVFIFKLILIAGGYFLHESPEILEETLRKVTHVFDDHSTDEVVVGIRLLLSQIVGMAIIFNGRACLGSVVVYSVLFVLTLMQPSQRTEYNVDVDQPTMDFVLNAYFAIMFGYFLFISENAAEKMRRQKRETLVKFYKKHNPEKLKDIDRIMEKYHNAEDLLFVRLEKKYPTAKQVSLKEAKEEEFSQSNDESTSEDNFSIEENVVFKKTEEVKTFGVVRSAMEEARAAQRARIEERIKQLQK